MAYLRDQVEAWQAYADALDAELDAMQTWIDEWETFALGDRTGPAPESNPPIPPPTRPQSIVYLESEE